VDILHFFLWKEKTNTPSNQIARKIADARMDDVVVGCVNRPHFV
jgi:hypothetical protein